MRFSPAKLDFTFIALVMFGIGTIEAAWNTLPRLVRGKTVVVVEEPSLAAGAVAAIGALVVSIPVRRRAPLGASLRVGTASRDHR